jgi:hypothetical protein
VHVPIPALLLATAMAAAPAVSPPGRPSAVSVARAASPMLQLAWGSGEGKAGNVDAREANFEGPKAFAVDERGAVHLLDQVNGRVQVFEKGRFARALPLPGTTYDDLVLDVDGGLVVMDRLQGDTLDFLDPYGRLQRQVRLPGGLLHEGGHATALFRRDDGFWAEVGARFLIQLADAQGRPVAKRPTVAGRHAPEPGRALRTRIVGTHGVELLQGSLDGKRRLAPLARHHFAMPVHLVEGVEVMRDGRLALAVQLVEEGPAPRFEVVRQTVVLMVLDPATGRELARAEVPATSAPEEAFRRLRAGADGAVYYLTGHEAGVTLWRWTP